MEQVPIRELNQNTAGVIERVTHGETVEITSHGTPVARLVPISQHGELDDLVASGWATPPTNRRPFTVPAIKAPAGEDAAELIRRLRDEERV